MLENRDNPANNYWMGNSADFTDAANWTDGRPTSDDQLFFVGSYGGIPPGSGLPPLPTGNPNTSTTFVAGPYSGHYFPNSYAGIHLISGYAATLGIDFDITFGDYEHAGGATNTPNRNVTITGQFNWTGGTVNSSAYAGEYRLQSGLLGTANPAGNTVSLGSAFRIMQNVNTLLGSTLQMFRGTYNLTNGYGFEVESGGLLNLNPVPKEGVVSPPPPTTKSEITINGQQNPPNNKGRVTVKQGGMCVVKPVERTTENKDWDAEVEFVGETPRLLNFDAVSITDRSVLKFIPTEGDNEGQNGGYIQNSFGINPVIRTLIEAGCTLDCGGKTKVEINDGVFELTERRSNGQPEATQPDITVKSEAAPVAVFIDTDATLRHKGSDTLLLVPLTLKINSSTVALKCFGTLELYAHKSDYASDQIEAVGEVLFGVGTNSTVRMKWFVDNISNPGYADYWVLVKSTGDEITNTPAFDPPPMDFPEYLIPGVSPDKKQFRVLPVW